MSLIEDTFDWLDDFRKEKHPFIVGLVAVLIISLVLGLFYLLISTLSKIIPPFNHWILVGVVVVAFLIYKFGVWLQNQ